MNDSIASAATPEGASAEPREQRANRLRIIVSQGCQSAGDQVVGASTVLVWLLAALGAPAWTLGLLVPIRESGSMLPQAAMTPWVLGRRRRTWVWAAGAAGQGVATAAMAGMTVTMTGTAAGVGILLALAVFALGRALTSMASKDVLGRTVPKGERGDVNGIAALVAGVVGVTVGLGLQVWGGDAVGTGVLALLLVAAALAWAVGALILMTIREPVDEPGNRGDIRGDGWLADSLSLLREDAPFRRFVMVRALLLVSALSPPFIVGLAAEQGGNALSGLGAFVIASGLAAVIGGRPFGRLADRSSRDLLVRGAAAASAVILATLALREVPGMGDSVWLLLAAYFLLTLTHTGVRVARKTYVVDMADGDRRTRYVAVANTTMGVLLLVAGAISSALAQVGPGVALVFLAALGVLGVVLGRSLPNVSDGGG